MAPIHPSFVAVSTDSWAKGEYVLPECRLLVASLSTWRAVTLAARRVLHWWLRLVARLASHVAILLRRGLHLRRCTVLPTRALELRIGVVLERHCD